MTLTIPSVPKSERIICPRVSRIAKMTARKKEIHAGLEQTGERGPLMNRKRKALGKGLGSETLLQGSLR